MAVNSVAVEPDWGIDPVPEHARRLRALDIAVLWGDLGIGLLVLVTGALLVPALGFIEALVVIAIGSVIGVALLGLVGSVGAREGVPTMVLFRPILGTRGSWVPSALNFAQLLGWTAVELWAMSYVADLVTSRVFGISARGLWLAVAALACTGLALWGPVGVTRVWMERFGAWVIAGISLAVTILVLASGELSVLTEGGAGGWPTFGPALDLVIAMPVSWLPLVADYNRFATGTRAAFRGTCIGYLIANVWLYSLGALLVLSGGAEPSPAGVAAGILAVAGGSLAGLLFLIGLLAGEADEAFADIYSGAMSLKNVWPHVPRTGLVVAIGGIATLLAGWLTMERYESFLFLIGSVFVPLFGVFVAHYFLRSGARTRAAAFTGWLIGSLTYHWITPTGPAGWVDAVVAVVGTPLSVRWEWLNASVPSFVVAFVVAAGAQRLSSARSRPPAER